MAEPAVPPPVDLSQSTATTNSDETQLHDSKKEKSVELQNLLECALLCGSVDAVTGEVHGASNSVVLDVILSGAVLIELAKRHRIVVEVIQKESKKMGHTFTKTKEVIKLTDNNNNSNNNNSNSGSSSTSGVTGDFILDEAVAEIQSVPERPRGVQDWINEFAGRTATSKHKLKDLKKKTLYRMVERGVLTYEKHTVRHDRFPITPAGHPLQEQLYATVRGVLLEDNNTPSFDDIILTCLYTMIDVNCARAVPKEKQQQARRKAKELHENIDQIVKRMCQTPVTTATEATATTTAATTATIPPEQQQAAGIIASVIKTTMVSTTDSLS